MKSKEWGKRWECEICNSKNW